MRFGPWLVLVALSLLSARARADSVAYLRELFLHPSDPRLMVLRYDGGYGGLLFSRDGGHTFSLLPSLAILKSGLRWSVPMQFASDGRLLIATSDGLLIDDGDGCAFSSSGPLEGAFTVDLAPHPSDPEVIFALTQASSNPDEHGGLWRRTATEITPLGASDPPRAAQRRHLALPTSLKVVARSASAGGLRFVEGALLSEGGDPTKPSKPVLRISDDLGATWTSHEIPLVAGLEGSPRLLVIEGSDPFRALVSLEGGSNDDISERGGPEPLDPIFLTTDSGATFSLHNAELKMADQALRLPSGRILIADRGLGGGLWSAPSIDAPLSKILEEPAHCLGYRAETDTLFLCRSHELGVLDLATNTFCAFFQNREALNLQFCPNQPVTAKKDAFEQLCNNWCGPHHFPTSSVCANTPVLAPCAAVGVAWDLDAGIKELPGELAATRCAPPMLLAPDAGGDHAGDDAGVDDEPDAGDDRNDSGGEGCGCRLARTRSSDGRLAVVSLLSLCAFGWRRRARQARRKRAISRSIAPRSSSVARSRAR